MKQGKDRESTSREAGKTTREGKAGKDRQGKSRGTETIA
jgi:hypothetical protein